MRYYPLIVRFAPLRKKCHMIEPTYLHIVFITDFTSSASNNTSEQSPSGRSAKKRPAAQDQVPVKKVKTYKPKIKSICSFSQTGVVGIEQKLYSCVTCNMQDGHCICEVCIKNCHKGHKVVFSEEDAEGYCDCGEQGSRGITSCNMLKGRLCSFY